MCSTFLWKLRPSHIYFYRQSAILSWCLFHSNPQTWL
jgi:hypothetical protein